MPRVYTSANAPVDFCARHFPDEATALKLYGNKGKGPDGRGNCFSHGAEHPDYDYETYDCATCGCRLTGRDN